MDSLTSLLFLMCGMMTLVFVIVLLYWNSEKDKIKILYFETPVQSKMLSRKVDEQGQVKIGKKAFSVIIEGASDLKTTMIRTWLGWKPLYRCDYDSNVLIPFHKGEKTETSPNALKILGELTTLEKIAQSQKLPLMMILLVLGCGIAIGAVAIIMLTITGTISFAPASSAVAPLMPSQLPPVPV